MFKRLLLISKCGQGFLVSVHNKFEPAGVITYRYIPGSLSLMKGNWHGLVSCLSLTAFEFVNDFFLTLQNLPHSIEGLKEKEAIMDSLRLEKTSKMESNL